MVQVGWLVLRVGMCPCPFLQWNRMNSYNDLFMMAAPWALCWVLVRGYIHLHSLVNFVVVSTVLSTVGVCWLVHRLELESVPRMYFVVYRQWNMCGQDMQPVRWPLFCHRRVRSVSRNLFEGLFSIAQCGIFHNVAYISGRSDWICMKILSQTYPWTRKSPLNLGSNPDLEFGTGPDSFCRRYAVSDCLCCYYHCCSFF